MNDACVLLSHSLTCIICIICVICVTRIICILGLICVILIICFIRIRCLWNNNRGDVLPAPAASYMNEVP